MGVLPGRYPRELLDALGMLGVELWDPPGALAKSSQHLQPFVCSVVHRALERMLMADTDVDGYLFPHLCDSIQNLFTVVRDCIGAKVPLEVFYPPRHQEERRGAVSYVAGHLRELAEILGAVAGSGCTDEKMAAAVARNVEMMGALADLYAARAEGRLTLSNTDFYEAVREWEYRRPGDVAARWRQLPASGGPASGTEGVSVVLSGLLPDRGLLRLLDERKVAVVEDDLLSCGRRLVRGSMRRDGDPWLAAAANFLALPPCSSIASPVESRLAFLEELKERSGARAILFHTVKFCEMELFDHPFLVRHLKARGVPVLVLESELYQSRYGQVETRLDAFLEMIG
jgi:benzoyl-CoA reductase/2-hydroxyglutaryl-CoA dehydratase subunit BcrC/BadD/HgdB